MNLKEKRTKDFVNHVRRTARLCNVRVVLRKAKKIDCYGCKDKKEQVHGFFEAPDEHGSGAIVVAVNRPRSKWVGCLAHEFGHMCQWFFNQKVWYDCDIPKYGDAAEVIHDWEKGKEFPDNILERAFSAVRRIEQDADQKAMMYIEEWKLPVDLHIYRVESDNYDYSYMMMYDNRKWKFMRKK